MARNEKLAALANKIPDKLTKGEMEQYRDKIKERDETLVTGVFRNLEDSGKTIRFPFRVHKGTPINEYTFEDGGIYTVPYAVAYHIEHKCNRYSFKRAPNNMGSSRFGSSNLATGASSEGMQGGSMTVEHARPRFSFLSSDIPQRSNKILTY